MKKTLALAALLLAGSMAFASPANAATMDDVESIQAYTDGTIYGTCLTQVDVTYKEGVDLSGLTADSYILEDRGTLTPEFGEVAIGDVTVDGQVATLNIEMVTAATANNDLIYTGNGAGKRERNSFGAVVTGPWYRTPEGQIVFGPEDTDEYKANETGMGYQARPTLELKLRHADEPEEAAACLADDKGQYAEGGLWLPQIDRQFGEGGFISFEEAGIEIPTTANKEVVTDGTGDDFVRGFFYVPENYDPASGIIFILQGQGICYWQLPDGSNNYGTAIKFDNVSSSWTNTGAIVVQINDRSSAGPGEYFDVYDFVLDDVNVMKYFIDTYGVTGNIVIQGNSRGTMASSIIIKALAGRPYHPWEQKANPDPFEKDHLLDKSVYDFTIDCFICNNGSLGATWNTWDDDDYKAVIATGFKAWMFDGEQDTNNVDDVAKWIELGGDPKNVRLTGYPSPIYYFWGESDHSTTRMNGWYFADDMYYGPSCTVDPETYELVYTEKLNPGDHYTLVARGKAAGTSKDGYEYTMYGEHYHDWAFAPNDTVATTGAAAPVSADAIEKIQATVIASFYGYKVGSVDITYAEGTDLSGVQLSDYTVYDRGFNNPEFGPLNLCGISVNENVVTLKVDEGTDKVEDRKRETYGTLCTSSAWYIDKEGTLHFGEEPYTDALGIEFAPNTIKKGLQRRENLDLILCVGGAPVQEGIASTNGLGVVLEDSKWEAPVLADDLDKIQLEMVNVGHEAPDYTLLSDEGLVPVHVIFPEGYDANREEPYPIVDYQCGGGVCYWEVTDEENTPANNLGCNTVYDVMMTEWHRQRPDAIIMSVNVHSYETENAAGEICSVLDYAIENWNADKEDIVLVGNSQGTIISSDVVRQRPDLVNGYVVCNGDFGKGSFEIAHDGTLAGSTWGDYTEEEVKAIIDNEVSVWMFNGETDGMNPVGQQDLIPQVKELYREAGKDEAWINLHVRNSGLQSWQFKKWGETDHSVTKVVAWKYLADPYKDIVEGARPQGTGTTYQYAGLEEDYENYQFTLDYDYTVYPESVADWSIAITE